MTTNTLRDLWWESTMRVYDRFVEHLDLKPYYCDRPASKATKAGIALSDGNQFHTLVSYHHGWVRGGTGIGFARFDDLDIVAVVKPARVIFRWEYAEYLLDLEMQKHLEECERVIEEEGAMRDFSVQGQLELAI